MLYNSKFRRKHEPPPCDEMHEDDGIDPRILRRNADRIKNSHQEHRLCKQISDVISVLFSGVCSDERLCMLGVESVKPAPDISCLCITVFPLYSTPQPDPEEIMLLLKTAKSFLRKEVAAEISRRRVPDFTFRVIIDPEKFLWK